MASPFTTIKAGLLVCCSKQDLKTQFRRAFCQDCKGHWHAECAHKSFQFGGSLTLEQMTELKGKGKKDSADTWSWSCPRCCGLKRKFQEQDTLDKAAAKKESKHDENYRRCKEEGCQWEGYGGDAGLKTHVDAKHNGIKFKCEDCGKEGFSTKGALTRHIKNACPVRPGALVPAQGKLVVATVIHPQG
jgi:hypothetical protein